MSQPARSLWSGCGFDSSIEGFAASVVIWQLRGAHDEERERRALRLIALTFFALAAYVVFESVRDLVTNAQPETSVVGIGVAIVSIIVMPTLGFVKRRLAQKMNSPVLRADAAETFLCSWLSAILLAGLVLNATVGRLVVGRSGGGASDRCARAARRPRGVVRR